MTYATLQQLTDRFGEDLLIRVTDRGDVATDTVDTDVVDRALADTDAMIDGYLAGRYALPMATTPPLVTDLAQVIAIYKLHVYQPDEKIERDYDQAIKQLRDIASGTIKLPVAGAEPEGTGGTGAQVTDRERPMTEDNLKGFI
jgi:phage gp36-like protein